MREIRLPPCMGSKTKTPYEQMWAYIRKRFPPLDKEMLMENTAVKVHPETDKILHDREREYLRKKNKHLTDRAFSWSFGMHWLKVSVSESEKVPVGKAWIDVEKLYAKKERNHGI